MDFTQLNSGLIDSMSTEDLRTIVKEAYSSAMLDKFKAEETAKAEEAKRAEATASLDNYFATKWQH